MTVSRFERGERLPRTRSLLACLARAADHAGLSDVANLFRDAAAEDKRPRVVANQEIEVVLTTTAIMLIRFTTSLDP